MNRTGGRSGTRSRRPVDRVTTPACQATSVTPVSDRRPRADRATTSRRDSPDVFGPRPSPATSASSYSSARRAGPHHALPALPDSSRFAADRLSSLATRRRERPTTACPRCSSSACRTPAVRRWRPRSCAHLAGDRVHVLTAGSEPAARSIRVVAALDEIGVPLGGEYPEAPHRRGRSCRGRRDHDGMRRRLPDLPGPPLPRLGSRGPGRAAASRGSVRSATRSKPVSGTPGRHSVDRRPVRSAR